MIYAKNGTAITVSFGPVLDSTGAEYTSAVVGDVKICKNNGTPAALNASATLTHKEVGMYELVLTTSDISAVGQATLQLSKTTYVAPPVNLVVLPATVYDALITNATNATGGLLAATNTVSAVAGYVGSSGAAVNGSLVNLALPNAAPAAAGGLLISAAGITGATLDTELGRLDAAVSSRMATFSLPTNFSSLVIDVSGRLDMSKLAGQTITAAAGVTFPSSIGTSTLTQTQVSGGAYAINSSSFAFNAAVPLTTQQKADVTAAVPTAAGNASALLTAAQSAPIYADVRKLAGLTAGYAPDGAGGAYFAGALYSLGDVGSGIGDFDTLLDFLNNGYSDSTHKVAGVVLTDTATALGAAYDAAKTAAQAGDEMDLVADAVDAAAVKADAVTEIQAGLATAAKLTKYIQLLARKDAAIATDNATELTAINASGGSGAGAFDNTTDSEQAIRDRGDAAWTTGGGGGGGGEPSDVDGITFNSAMECILAVVAGVATRSGNTISFKKRDGTTTKIQVTVGATDGERTASTIP